MRVSIKLRYAGRNTEPNKKKRMPSSRQGLPVSVRSDVQPLPLGAVLFVILLKVAATRLLDSSIRGSIAWRKEEDQTLSLDILVI